jgi:hypothetical protein
MKKHVLNFGVSANHDLITVISNFAVPASISDYDAFITDPALLQPGIPTELCVRRQQEIHDLVMLKGGLAICILRKPLLLGYGLGGRQADSFSIFDSLPLTAIETVRVGLRAGSGSQIEVVKSAMGPLAHYLRILKGALNFVAYLTTPNQDLESQGGTIFAVDSVSHPVAVEFALGAGRLCFVPVAQTDPERIGSAVIRVLEAHYGGPSEIEPPTWAAAVSIPGADANDSEIAELEAKQEEIRIAAEQLKWQREQLLNYRVLLFGYGKSVLEQ